MAAKSAPSLFPVVATAPGVSIAPTAASPDHALAVNYADGSLNSSDHPAAPGQYVILYLTGQGPSIVPSRPAIPRHLRPFCTPPPLSRPLLAASPRRSLLPAWFPDGWASCN